MRMKSLSVRRLISLLSASALVATLAVAGLPAAPVSAAGPVGTVIYDSTPTPLPPNMPSQAFQAQQTQEFGNLVAFTTGTQRLLTKVTVGMSDWAVHSDYPLMPSTGWTHDITLNLYAVGGATGSPAPGTVIKSVTQQFTIPWRPETVCASDPTAYLASDGNCYHGLAFNITFDLTGLGVVVPGQLIFGIAYNTSTWGYAPIGAPGPYDSLNVLLDTNTGVPSVGSDPFPGSVFWNTWTASSYGDGGVGGVGTFRWDDNATNWNGYVPAIQFTALPVCTPTGLMRDGINLTAALINPTGTVSGTLDATGCNIGVYYGPGTSGTVSGANISGSNYYGVVANAAAVNVTNATIHDIGETPLNGSQHGVGVLYTTIDQAGNVTGPSATGTLSGTTITKYQKNGVVISGSGAKVTVSNSTVTGEGGISYIAQNGIQVSFAGSAKLFGNTVTLNNYLPSKVTACGLLIYKAGGVSGASKTGISFIKADNNFHNNETDVCNFGKGGGFSL